MSTSIVTSSPSYRSWDVVVVPFPYTEMLAEKRRPALVISGPKLHRLGFLWLVMITGAAKQKRLGDIVISDLQSAGLPGASMARTSKIATVEPTRVLRRIGAIARGERAALAKSIGSLLAAP